MHLIRVCDLGRSAGEEKSYIVQVPDDEWGKLEDLRKLSDNYTVVEHLRNSFPVIPDDIRECDVEILVL